MRVNGLWREGDTAVDHQSKSAKLAALGLDIYTSEASRRTFAQLAAQARATGGLPPEPAPAMARPAPEVTVPAPAGFTPREWRLLGAAAIVSVACALLVLGGAALLYKL